MKITSPEAYKDIPVYLKRDRAGLRAVPAPVGPVMTDGDVRGIQQAVHVGSRTSQEAKPKTIRTENSTEGSILKMISTLPSVAQKHCSTKSTIHARLASIRLNPAFQQHPSTLALRQRHGNPSSRSTKRPIYKRWRGTLGKPLVGRAGGAYR